MSDATARWKGPLDALALAIGALLAALALGAYASQAVRDFEELALGKENTSRYATLDGVPIHCEGVPDAEDCIAGVRARGSRPTLLWLGNSQLHSVNQPKPGDRTAPEILGVALRARGRDLVAFSQPNANAQEHLVLFLYLADRLPLRQLVLPLVFDDFRESGLRQDVIGALEDPGVREALARHEVGATLLANHEEQAGGSLAALEGTVQQRSEVAANAWLEEHSLLWELRPRARGQLFSNLYVLRNKVFGISPTSKRRTIPGRMDLNLAATRALLLEARDRGIEVIAYVVPLRDDVEAPYIESEYRDFKRRVERLITSADARFVNLESLVPPEYWGRMKSRNLGEDPEIDFMHFQGQGHELLAAAVGELLADPGAATAP